MDKAMMWISEGTLLNSSVLGKYYHLKNQEKWVSGYLIETGLSHHWTTKEGDSQENIPNLGMPNFILDQNQAVQFCINKATNIEMRWYLKMMFSSFFITFENLIGLFKPSRIQHWVGYHNTAEYVILHKETKFSAVVFTVFFENYEAFV